MSTEVFITGICGFVGSELAVAFRERFPESVLRVRGIDNLSRKGCWRNRERLAQRGIDVSHGDIRLQSDVETIGKVDWVIDAAANPSVVAGLEHRSGSRQLLESNLSGTVNLLEHCKSQRAGFIHLSTSRVYSIPPLARLAVNVCDGAFEPIATNCPLGVTDMGISERFSVAAPISLYGATKLASEQLALEYGYTFDFPVWINRCGVMAGAGQFGKSDQGIFAFWLHSWKEKTPLRYIGFDGQGHQVRDCLHPHDLAELLIRQLKANDGDQPRIVNVSGGPDSAISLQNLSRWCENRWGPRSVTSDPTPRQFDLPWVVLDAQLATEVWNWKPTKRTEQILEEIAAFAETQPRWIELSQ
ncbi:NAD-dependent epimerase/dehydratase family protein [Roseiconus lacunae]|uniref:NAD-dependent epimerase/dehydratase family protein n=1 Tax=Roseiconus lacunae TaxID=2605694 RepID=UPI001E64E33D|nr:NAD-dependent epimerase/dehydratase family protein [Roseiconus lacunae]MCD0463016.1 NAD-dependent epimerase/dehydratase family protein [Roseiconus lacunae]